MSYLLWLALTALLITVVWSVACLWNRWERQRPHASITDTQREFETKADAYADSVLHLFTLVGTNPRPITKPTVRALWEFPPAPNAVARYVEEDHSIVFYRPWKFTEKILVHELVHAWIHQSVEAGDFKLEEAEYPHGPFYLEKLKQVHQQLGWPPPDTTHLHKND